MAELQLDRQIERLASELSERVGGLHSNDPVHDWFSMELNLLTAKKNPDSFEEANAKLRALRQLSHLLLHHQLRINNPDQDDLGDGDPEASVCTIEARVPFGVLQTAREMRFSIEPSLLHEPAPDISQFDPVSPTAKIVGYLRGLDRSLQITLEQSVETEGSALIVELGITDPEVQASMAVLFQSRYHAINACIAMTCEPVRQIIEFAAGISPRGYQWSGMSPGAIYVESDLPQLMIHKAKLVRNAILACGEPRLGVMHCCAANVLNLDSILEAVGSLDSSHPFTIVTEGLLLYFSVGELAQFLENIREVLSRYPGSVWVTDLVSKANLRELLDSQPGVAQGVRKVFALTGREVVPDNPFENDACISKILGSYGLKVEATVALADVTQNLKFDVEIPQPTRDAIVGTRKIWRVMAKK